MKGFGLMTVDLSAHEDVTIRGLWGKVESELEALKDLHSRVQVVLPPTQGQVDEILKTSDDPQVASYREQLFKATEALRALQEDANAYILSGFQSLPEDEVERIKAEFKAKRSAVMTILNLIKSVAAQLGIEGVAEAVDSYEIPNIKGSSTVKGGTGSGGGTPRARVNSIVISRNGEELKRFEEKKAMLSAAALYMKTKFDAVYSAWLSAAKVANWQEITNTVTFELTNDAGLSYEVTVEPTQ